MAVNFLQNRVYVYCLWKRILVLPLPPDLPLGVEELAPGSPCVKRWSSPQTCPWLFEELAPVVTLVKRWFYPELAPVVTLVKRWFCLGLAAGLCGELAPGSSL